MLLCINELGNLPAETNILSIHERTGIQWEGYMVRIHTSTNSLEYFEGHSSVGLTEDLHGMPHERK